MKKIKSIVVLTLAMLLITSIPVYSNAAETPVFTMKTLGDVSGDSQVKTSDARLALRIAVKIDEPKNDYAKKAADFNFDGKVTTSDARSILRVAVSIDNHPYDEELFSEILKDYTDIMNAAKETQKPGFTIINYMNMPSDSENRGFFSDDEELLEMMQDLLDELLGDEGLDGMEITREDAIKDAVVTPQDSGMKAFPLFSSSKGCILSEPEYIRSAKKETLSNGNVRLTITLLDEEAPEVTEGDSNSSKVGSMFNPISKKFAEENLGLGDLKDETGMMQTSVSIPHRNSTAVLEYNPQTKQIVSLKHDMQIAMIFNVDALGAVFGFFQNIYSSYEWYDFKY